jgi:hypothetical protein
VFLALALRSYNAGVPSLWFDEAFSWRMSRFSAADVVARTALDNHSPFYFLLLKAWVAVCGDSQWALRWPSIMCGVLTVIGTFACLRRAIMAWDGPGWPPASAATRVAVLGALLVALSAFQVHWSQEVRMYSLGTALVVWSTWALVAALTSQPRAGRYWLLYAALTAAFLYTHYIAVLSVASQLLFLLLVLASRCGFRPGRWAADAAARGAGVAWLIIIWACLPWAPTFFRQHAQVHADFWIRPVDLAVVQATIHQMFGDSRAGMVGEAPAGPEWIAAATCLALNTMLLLLVWNRSPAAWLASCLGAGPIVMSLIISECGTPVFYVRYLIFAHVFLLAGVALVIGGIPRNLERRVLCVLVVVSLLWLPGVPRLWQPGPSGIGERLTARHVDVRRGDEPVIVCDAMRFLTLLYQSERRDGWRTYADGGYVAHYAGAAALLPGEVIDARQVASVSAAHAWTVDVDTGGYLRQRVPVPDSWKVVEEARFPTEHGAAGCTFVVRRYRTRSATDAHAPTTSDDEASSGRTTESARPPRS